MTAQLFSSDWLKVENNNGFGALPIPQPRDAAITQLLQAWVALDEPTRKIAAENSWTFGSSRTRATRGNCWSVESQCRRHNRWRFGEKQKL